MSVIESSGNGCHLYGTKRLKTAPEVNLDEYPFVTLQMMDGSTWGDDYAGQTLYGLICCQNAPTEITSEGFTVPAGNVAYAYFTWDEALANYLSGFIPAKAGEWTDFDLSTDTSDSVYSYEELVWSNTDLVTEDGTAILAASDPISLEGLTVIEWDGDKTNMVSAGDMWYKVSDVVLKSSQFYGTLVVSNGEIVKVSSSDADFLDQEGACGKNGYVVSSYEASLFPETGLYLFNSENTDTGESSVTTLFAFPKVVHTVDPDFWNGVACGLNGNGTPNFEESTAFGKGYTVGCKLREARPKNWLDNKLPIEFSAEVVKYNSARVFLEEGMPLIKVSNLVFTVSDLQSMRVTLMASDGSTEDTFTLSPYVAQETSEGVVLCIYAYLGSQEPILYVLSISEAAAGTEVDGQTIPEAGLYVLDYTAYAPEASCRFKIEKPDTASYAGFPLQFSLPGGLSSCDRATVTKAEGASYDLSAWYSVYKVFDTVQPEEILEQIHAQVITTDSDGKVTTNAYTATLDVDEYADQEIVMTEMTSGLVFFSVPYACTITYNTTLDITFPSPGTYLFTFSDGILSDLGSSQAHTYWLVEN